MGPARSKGIAVALFGAQAVVGLAWWAWLATSNDAPALFSVPADEAPTVFRLALADLVLFVGGSAVAAVLAARRSRWAAPAAWCVTGAAAYASLWCVGVAAWHGAPWFGAACMVPVAAADAVVAAWLSRLES